MLTINLGLSAQATGTVDVITATYSPAPTLVDKKILFLRTAGTNTTTAPTFNPNSLGAQTITKNNGDALAVGDLDGDVILMYDLANTNWELLTPKVSGGTTLTQDQIDAINNANAPDGTNPFATIGDVPALQGLASVLGVNNLANGTWSSVNGKSVINVDGSGLSSSFNDGTNSHQLSISETAVVVGFNDGTQSGNVGIDALANTIDHTIKIDLNAPSVKKNGVEVATTADIVPVNVNTIGSAINGASSATPNDTDLVMSVDTSVAKKNTWTQIKAFLKTYFDGLYAVLGASQDVKIVCDNTDHAVTGTTAETYLTGLLVPSLTTNSVIWLNAQFTRSGAAGTAVIKVYYNTTNDLAGTPVLIATSSTIITGQDYAVFQRRMANKNSLTSNKIFRAATGASTDMANNGANMTTIDADLSGKYIVFSTTNVSAADTITINNCQLTHWKP